MSRTMRICLLPLGGLLLLAGCATPPPPPQHAAAASLPASATRRVLEAQFAQRPAADAPAMSGQEASVIYSHYLRSIGSAANGGASGGMPGGSPVGYAPGGTR